MFQEALGKLPSIDFLLSIQVPPRLIVDLGLASGVG